MSDRTTVVSAPITVNKSTYEALLSVGIAAPGHDPQQQQVQFVLDTGAFELTLPSGIAQSLGLPNLGPVEVGGVGGTTAGYWSVCDVVFPGKTFPNVNCVVLESFPMPLFGLRFAINRNLGIDLDLPEQTVTFYAVAGQVIGTPNLVLEQPEMASPIPAGTDAVCQRLVIRNTGTAAADLATVQIQGRVLTQQGQLVTTFPSIQLPPMQLQPDTDTSLLGLRSLAPIPDAYRGSTLLAEFQLPPLPVYGIAPFEVS